MCSHSDILRMDSTNADALYVRGLCLYYEDCIEKAVQFFVQALRMAPDHEKARLACKVRRPLCLYSSRSELGSSSSAPEQHASLNSVLSF